MADEREPITVDLAPLTEDTFGVMTLEDVHQSAALRAFTINGGNIGEACKTAGVSRWSWQRWKKEDPAFQLVLSQIMAAKAEIRAERIVDVEEKLYELAEAGNIEAIKVLLKAELTKYRDRQVIEVIHPDVQRRLAATADVIVFLCSTELPEPHRSTFAPLLAAKLREIWS